MDRFVEFFRKNKDGVKTAISISLFGVFSVFAIIQLRHINFKQYHELFTSLSYFNRVMVLILGLVTFLFSTLYDFVLGDYFKIPLEKKKLFKISFITQSFNNFISFGGLTGTKLRSDMLSKNGVDSSYAIKMATSVLVSGLLGLCTLILPMVIIIGDSSHKFLYILGLLALYVPFYFLAGRLKFGKLQKFADENSPYSFLDNKVKFRLLLASLLDWLVMSLYFGYIIKMILPDANIIHAMLVFVVSEMVGICSFIPGGIGSFDLSVLMLMSAAGLDRDKVLLALILYRTSFYVIPWIIGVILFVKENLNLSYEKIKASHQMVANVVSTLIFISGLVLIISTATPSMIDRAKFLKTLMPKEVMRLTKELTLFIGVVLIILSRGIRLKIRKIYKITLGLLILGAVGCLVKGLDYEEAIILLIFAGLLYYTRQLYDKEHMEFKPREVYVYGGIFFFFTVLYVVVYNITHKVNIYSSKGPYSFYWFEQNPGKIIVFFLMAAVVLMLSLYSRKDYLDFKELTDEDVEKYDKFLEVNEGNYFSHLFYMKDKNVFYNSKGTVGFLYRPYKSNFVVLGDPFGVREDFEEAIDEIIEYASTFDMKVCFYEVKGANLELYANQGFDFIKLGEDATVDLVNFTYEGRQGKRLRQEHRKLESGEYKFEMAFPPFSEELMAKLKVISDSWLAGKGEMGFSLGGFYEYYINKAPVALLKDANDEILAFATLQTVANTKKTSIDLMRHNKEICKGSEMMSLFLGLIDYVKAEGYEEFYLGMAPLSNVGDKKYSGRKEKIIKLIYEYGDKFYSFQGLRLYKEKFHPKWNGRYLVYRNDMDLPDVLISILNIIHKETKIN